MFPLLIIDNKYGTRRRATLGNDRSDSSTSPGPRYHIHQAQTGTLGQVFSAPPSFGGGGGGVLYFFIGVAYSRLASVAVRAMRYFALIV